MTRLTAPAQRLGALLLGLALLALAAIAGAGPAGAVCVGDQCGDPTTWTSTLTIAVPQVGTVTATSTSDTYTCGSADTSGCTISDDVTTAAASRPTSGWPTYTLTWTGPAEDSAVWTGACTGSTCTVTNNQDESSVGEQLSTTWTSTLVVQAPAIGGILIDGAQYCRSGGSACVITDAATAPYGAGRPTTGWPAHSLSWQGPGGVNLAWSGACAGAGSGMSCTVVDDSPNGAASVATTDVQAPVLQSLSAPARVGPSSYFTLRASDNVAAYRRQWSICDASGACSTDSSGFAESSVAARSVMWNQRNGTYVVSLTVLDPSGNASNTISVTIQWVNTVNMTAELPAVTADPVMTFSTDEDAHVTTTQCRAYRVDTDPLPDYGPCTSSNSFAPTDVDGEGAWELDVVVTDDLGNRGYAYLQTIVDRTAPTLAVTDGPGEGAQVSTTDATWTFATSDDHPGSTTCTLDARQPVACTGSITLHRMPNGQHHLTITAIDAAGNQTSVTRHFSTAVTTSLAPTAPTVRSTWGTAATLGVRLNPRTAWGKVVFTSGGTTLCHATVTSGAATCATSPKLAVGTYPVTATYTGGYAASATTLTLTVAPAPTAVQGKAARPAPQRGVVETITASGLPGAATGTVAVSAGGTVLCSATVSRGKAVCTFPVALPVGPATLTVTYSGDAHYAASSTTVPITVR